MQLLIKFIEKYLPTILQTLLNKDKPKTTIGILGLLIVLSGVVIWSVLTGNSVGVPVSELLDLMGQLLGLLN